MTARDDWFKRKATEAKKVATAASELIDKIEGLPPSTDLLNREMAIQRVTDSVVLTIGKKLTPLQNQVAYLLGAGFEFSRAAETMGLPLDEVYNWHQTLPDFRHAIEYYTDITSRDIGSAARREVQLLLDDDMMETKDRLGLIKIMQEMGREPDKRWLDKINVLQKQQTIEQNAKQQKIVSLRIGNVPKDAIEADFTIIEDDEEEE